MGEPEDSKNAETPARDEVPQLDTEPAKEGRHGHGLLRRAWSTLSRKVKILIGAFLLAIVPLIAGYLGGLAIETTEDYIHDAPFTVGVGIEERCSSGDGSWYFPAEFNASTLPSFDQLDSKWAYLHGGYSTERSVITLSAEARGDKAVTLQSMRVKIIEREPLTPGIIHSKCLTTLKNAPETLFEIDLDEPNLELVPIQSRQGRLQEKVGKEYPPRFPVDIADKNKAHFEISAFSLRCACSWVVEIDWTAGGESGMLTVYSANNVPFRTTNRADDSQYVLHQPSK